MEEKNFSLMRMKLRSFHDPSELFLIKKPFQKAFKKQDTNDDGVLDLQEWLRECLGNEDGCEDDDKSGNDYNQVKKDKLSKMDVPPLRFKWTDWVGFEAISPPLSSM